MKKILALCILISTLLYSIPIAVANESGYFIVTAYYSPLPDQDYYITGSYESEKRLNGQGIAGASGKGVFSGMLAAPAKYSFGTKIYLEGLGIGSVEDRGGAIVPAGERGYGHDRIDVWVGYGDEGLRRAMYWGKRKIPGSVVSRQSQTSLKYESIPAPSWAVPKTTTLYGKKVVVAQSGKEQKNTIKEPDIFSVSLGKGSSEKYITMLQEILQKIGYYTTDAATGIYDTHTIDAVYNFQVNHDVVKNESDPGAGFYGPKTRKMLENEYKMFLEEKRILEEKQAQLESGKLESNTKAEKHIQNIGKPLYGEISPRVRELQKTLKSLGYFEYKDTAIFGVKTQNSIIEYQLENTIITDITAPGTGIFGPATRASMVEKLSGVYFQEFIAEHQLEEMYLRSKEKDLVETEEKTSEQANMNFTILSA